MSSTTDHYTDYEKAILRSAVKAANNKKDDELETYRKALDRMCNLVGYEYNYCCHHSEVDGKCKGGSCLECWKGWAIEDAEN